VAFAAGLIPGRGTDGGGSALHAAFAVEQNPDGTVTVEIRSIEDAAGLERQLEDTGIPASVHYLPPGKLCNVRRYQVQEEVEVDVADRLSGRPMPHVEVSQTEAGAFRFTIDPALLEPDESVVIWTMYAVPEHGQAGDAVASIVAMIEHGNRDDCELVDGSIEGWGFQEGAPVGTK
jgi:hypothetical protein